MGTLTINLTNVQPLDSLLTDISALSYSGNANKYLRVNATADGFEFATVAGGGTWGSITGNLSDQTDLQNALNAKADTSALSSYLTTAAAASTYVPYTGASSAVDLGANNLTVDTNTFFVDATNNRVGIGTTSPARLVSLYATGDNSRLAFFNDSTGTSITDGTFIGLDDGVNFSIWQRETGYVRFATTDLERLRITSGGLITFGGVTSSFPALKRSSTELQVRLADDSSFAPIQAAGGTFNGVVYGQSFGLTTPTKRTIIYPTGADDRDIAFRLGHNNSGNSSFRFLDWDSGALLLKIQANGLVSLMGETSSFPALKRSGTELQVRLADDSGYAPIQASQLTISAGNIVTDTTTGMKIGTGTTQKLGFWNATPVVQQTTSIGGGTIVTSAGTNITTAFTFDGYRIDQVVAALRLYGILA